MEIEAENWERYAKMQGRLRDTAAGKMEDFTRRTGRNLLLPGSATVEDLNALTEQAYLLVTEYGEASAALACQIYDEIAEAQEAGKPGALPAETASPEEIRSALRDVLENTLDPAPALVGKLVKQAGEDTMLKNAVRDGAEWAWIPWGTETCAFCITLASQDWQPASPSALKGGHASHIHANCYCEYAIRFDKKSTVQGYDPDKYLAMYKGANLEFWNTPDGKPPAWDKGAEQNNSKNRINAMRRENYAKNREKMREQKRAAYARRREAARKAGE